MYEKRTFFYDKELNTRKDAVAMGSPLRPAISEISMVDLERNMIPKLLTHMTKGQRYVDETTAYIEPVSINYIPSNLNSSQKNINLLLKKKKIIKFHF